MNTIKFEIQASPESNDHEVRLIVDDYDLLGDDFLGLDPPSFFKQNFFPENGMLMIGRCTCGCEGCSDFPIEVETDDTQIRWIGNAGLNLTFDKKYFEEILSVARNDHSWEDEQRQIERLVTQQLDGKRTKSGYLFDWASARVKENTVTLSFSKNDDQKLFELVWDKSLAENTLIGVTRFIKQEGIVRERT